MIEMLLVTLLQAIAGDPAPPAEPATQTAAAPAEAAQQAESAEQQTAASDEVRCRREPVLGSRVSRRVCTTAAQDAAMEEEARSMVNRAQSQMTTRD